MPAATPPAVLEDSGGAGFRASGSAPQSSSSSSSSSLSNRPCLCHQALQARPPRWRSPPGPCLRSWARQFLRVGRQVRGRARRPLAAAAAACIATSALGSRRRPGSRGGGCALLFCERLAAPMGAFAAALLNRGRARRGPGHGSLYASASSIFCSQCLLKTAAGLSRIGAGRSQSWPGCASTRATWPRRPTFFISALMVYSESAARSAVAFCKPSRSTCAA